MKLMVEIVALVAFVTEMADVKVFSRTTVTLLILAKLKPLPVIVIVV
jgi:hypothetical protein